LKVGPAIRKRWPRRWDYIPRITPESGGGSGRPTAWSSTRESMSWGGRESRPSISSSPPAASPSTKPNRSSTGYRDTTQLTSYDTGALEFFALRRKAEEALGPKFDIKAFHDQAPEVRVGDAADAPGDHRALGGRGRRKPLKRWNGWGSDDIDYPVPPSALAYLAAALGPASPGPSVPLEAIVRRIPASRLPENPLLVRDPETRLRRSRGHSLPDWIALRFGSLDRFPDGVALPASEEEVERILAFAKQTGTWLIPTAAGRVSSDISTLRPSIIPV